MFGVIRWYSHKLCVVHDALPRLILIATVAKSLAEDDAGRIDSASVSGSKTLRVPQRVLGSYTI